MTLQRAMRFGFAILIATLFVGCGGATTAVTPRPTQATEVSVADAAAMRDAGALVIDVREPSEYAAGHIPNATLIPLGQLQSRLREVPHNRAILVVCHSGNRSAQGRDILLAAGYPTVTSVAGGMIAWAAAGLPVTTGS